MKYTFKLNLIVLVTVIFTNLLFSQTEDSGISFIFARKLYDDKMYDLAAEQFHQFAEQNPDNPKAAEALYLAGLSYFNIKNYQQAKKELLYLILKFPNAKDLDLAQFKIAECFQALGDLSAAAQAYRQLQVFYPKSSLAERALFTSASMYVNDRKFENAIEILYEFLEIYPTSSFYHEALILSADAFIGLGNFDRAQMQIDKVLATTEIGTINAKALLLKANLYYQLFQFQQAENTYTKLIEKYAVQRFSNDQNITLILNEAYYFISDLLRKKGLFEKSNEFGLKIKGYESDSKLLFLIGENYFSLKNYSKAIEIFKKMLFVPDSIYLSQAYFQMGNSYLALNDYANAIPAYEKVINSKTNSVEDHSNIYYVSHVKISDCYLNLNQPMIAISFLKKYSDVVNNEETRAAIQYRIAYFYETKVRDSERAIRAYYDFIDNYPRSQFIDEAKLGLARSYENNNNYPQALFEYQNFISRYPASKYYDEVQNRIEYLRKYFQIENNVIKNLSGVIQQLAERETNQLVLYQLGLTYFKELKDYRSSIELFKQIYGSNEASTIQKDELQYYLARSFQLLGEKSLIDNQEQTSSLDSAEFHYNLLIQNFPESSWSDDAAFHQIEIKELNLKNNPAYFSQMKDALTSFAYKNLNSSFIDEINFKLALLLLEKGITSSIDSLDIYNNLQKIITEFPKSPLLPEAKYLQALLFIQTKNFGQAREKLKDFIAEYPNHHRTCEAYFQIARLAEIDSDYSTAIDFLKQITIKHYYSHYADSAKLIIGAYLTKQQKYSEALSYYMDIYEKYQNNDTLLEINNDSQVLEEVIFKIASILQATNYKDEAIKFYQIYLNKFPKGKYADRILFSLSELYSTSEKAEQSKAMDYLQQLENDFSSSELISNAMIKLGDILFDREKYEEARQYYSKALNNILDGDQQVYASAKSIICLYRTGKIALADEQFKTFKKQFRDEKKRQAEILLEKGDFFLRDKNFVEAEKIFKDVRSDFKNMDERIKAEYLLGKLYFILNKDEDALEILTDLIKKYPGNQIQSEVYITLGNFYYLQAKQIENALFAYKNATEVEGISDQNLMISMHNLIKCYGDLRLWDKAINISRLYLEKFPTVDDALEKKIQIGYFYFQLKEYDYAIQLFKRLKPEADADNEPRIQFWIGECYFEKGDFQQAISEYLKIAYLSKPAKLLGQYRVTAQYKAAISYLKTGKLENAKQLFQMIVTEQGAESAFGKPAKEKLEEIERMMTVENKGNI